MTVAQAQTVFECCFALVVGAYIIGLGIGYTIRLLRFGASK